MGRGVAVPSILTEISLGICAKALENFSRAAGQIDWLEQIRYIIYIESVPRIHWQRFLARRLFFLLETSMWPPLLRKAGYATDPVSHFVTLPTHLCLILVCISQWLELLRFLRVLYLHGALNWCHSNSNSCITCGMVKKLSQVFTIQGSIQQVLAKFQSVQMGKALSVMFFLIFSGWE